MSEFKLEAEVKNLQSENFFNIGCKNIFVVPKYQREYTWGKDDWQALFEDISTNENGYFLGSMLCIKIKDYEHESKKFFGLEVVDGQQRLTTLGLFFLAIHHVLQDYKEKVDAFDEEIISNLRKYLIVTFNNKGSKENFSRIFPQTNKGNRSHYLKLLEGEFQDVTFKKDKAEKTDRKINAAFKFFQDCLKDYVKDLPDVNSQYDKIVEVYEKLCDTKIVRIVAENNSDAYVLFEALNNRGVPLTLADLIKNQLLAKLSEQVKNSDDSNNIVQKYLDYWNDEIIGKIPKINRAEMERFFRQIYNVYRKSWAEKYPALGEKLKIAERSNLLKMYETIINEKTVNIRIFIEDLKTAAKFYSHVQFQDESLDETKISFADLRHIDGSTSGTLLIYLLKNKAALQLTDENFKNIQKCLCKLFVRRSFTGKPRSNSLDDIFIKFIEEIAENSYTGAKIEENLRERLKAVSADDESFIKELRGDVYSGDKDTKTRFILDKIANAHLPEKQQENFWDNAKNWQIEHILPQTIKAKKKTPEKLDNYWINILGGGDEIKAAEIQSEYLHKLGNLSLTLYNAELSNKPFPDKIKLKDDNGNAIGLVILSENNGLNSYVVAQEVWTPKEINERTEILIKEILKIFAW